MAENLQDVAKGRHTVSWSRADAREPVLTGLRVLRLGRSRAGNYLSRILSDQGATFLDADELTAAADGTRPGLVVVNDLGRGATPPSGLDYESLARRDPALVYCSLVSFPEGGPTGCAELEDEPVLTALGLNRYASEEPRREPLPAPSFFGAAIAAIHIVCALRPHISSAGPQAIEVSLFAATLNTFAHTLATFKEPRFAEAPRLRKLPIAEIYRCADGRYLQPHATYPHFVHILCNVGGHPEWAQEAGRLLRTIPDQATEQLWRSRFAEMFLRRTAAEWEHLIEQAKGSATICRSRAEWRNEEHARLARIFVPDPSRGGWRLGPATIVTANPVRPGQQIRPAPQPANTRGPNGKPLPLAGSRVVDFCIIIAGPTMGRYLAELGADVTKVEARDRELSPNLWLDVNRGKRSIVLDLKSAEGREIAARLIDRADILTENFRHGKFAALGFGHEKLIGERPDLIYGSTNALDYEGPWAQRPGWEHNAQAASGQQVARQDNGVPQQVPFPVNDYATGTLGALGIVLAILRRDRTGIGSRARGSLVRSGTFLQFASYEPWHDASTTLAPAETLRCSDGYVSAWLARAATPEQRIALAEAGRMANDRPAASVAERLRNAGVTALVEIKPADLLQQPWLFEKNLAVKWTHPVYGAIEQLTPHAEASGFEARPGFPAPEPGAQTRQILAELGYGSKVDSWLASGAVTADMKLLA